MNLLIFIDFIDLLIFENTLVSEDNKRIQAHKVVLASAGTLFRDMFQNDEEEKEYEVINLRGVSSRRNIG